MSILEDLFVEQASASEPDRDRRADPVRTPARPSSPPPRGDTARAAAPRRRTRITALVLAVGALATMFASIPAMAAAPAHGFGLLFAGPVVYPVAIVASVLAFCIAIGGRDRPSAWIALVSVVLVIRLPVSLATELPLYSWTYKHFGVVDYIQVNGALARGVDIYHSWPAAFAGVAWINDLTGLETIDIARWFAPLMQLAFTAAIYALARAFGLTREASLVAGLVAQIVNWVGQDYFSPQAIALVMAVAVIALLVVSRRHRAASWIALFLYAAITVTHQLTPYWLFAIVVALTILGWIRPRWIGVGFFAILIGYLLANYEMVASFGNLLQFDALRNAQTNISGASSPGQSFSSLAGRATSVALWGSAGLALVIGFFRSRRTRRRLLAAGAIAFASFALLLGQGYGGEAIFRVMLYSIPGCVLLIAPFLTRLLLGPSPLSTSPSTARSAARARALRVRRRRRATRVLAGVALCVVALTGSQAYYGGWYANRVSPESLQASTDILLHADPQTLMIGLAPGAPGRTVARYVEFARINDNFDFGVSAWKGWLGHDFMTTDKVDGMTTDLLYAQQPAMVVITEQMKWYAEYYGMFPPGAIERYEQQLIDNPHWTVITQTPTLTVLELDLDSLSDLATGSVDG